MRRAGLLPEPGAPARRWRGPVAQALAWREWDGEHVVFDGASAATHLLDEPAGRVLRLLLEASPQDEDGLLARLAGGASEPDPEAPAALREVLAALERAGLARREAP